MSRTNKHHHKLNEQGIGKCSVPMWMGGLPCGFCNEEAYGLPLKDRTYRYSGYVPGLACPAHGGPNKPEEVNR